MKKYGVTTVLFLCCVSFFLIFTSELVRTVQAAESVQHTIQLHGERHHLVTTYKDFISNLFSRTLSRVKHSRVGHLLMLTNDSEKSVQAAEFLPHDILFYGEQHDFVMSYKDFSNSRLGRIISRIKYPDIVADLGGDEAAITEALQHWQKVDTLFNDPAFDVIFGKEFSLALFPAKSFSTAAPARAVEDRLLLIAKPRHDPRILKLLSTYAARDIEQLKFQYGTHAITRYKIDEQKSLSTAMVQGHVLAAFDERLILKSLTTYDGQIKTLADNVEYRRLRNTFRGAKFFQYISLSSLMAQGRMIAAELPEEERRQMLAFLELWEGGKAITFGAWGEKGLVRKKVEISYAAEKFNGEVATLLKVKPDTNGTLAMAPRDALFYCWTNNLSPTFLWNIFRAALLERHPGAFDLLQQELQDSVGMRLEEIFAMIANECGVVVKGEVEGGIPIPKATLMLKLKNPPRFMEIFNKLLVEADIPMNTNRYRGQDISYWGISPQDGLQPAFTLLGDYLLLSNSRDLVKEIVALSEDPENILLQDTGSQKLRKELARKSNSAVFVHVARLATVLKSIVQWAGGMAVIQGPETAHKVNVVVKELIVPLLDGMAMYTELATRAEVMENSIIVESTILVME